MIGKRTATADGLTLSEIGMGCYGLGGAYGPVDHRQYQATLRHAYELGVTFFDTAGAYGDAEALLGDALAPMRAEVIISTKAGVADGQRKIDCSRRAILAACDRSLQRLRTDSIDLFQIHYDDPVTPVAETVAALAELRQAGKIRHYGVGHLPAARVREYIELGDVATVMVELNPLSSLTYQQVAPLCLERGIGLIGFSVTARGLLTGEIAREHVFAADDIRAIDPLFRKARFESGLRVAAETAALGRLYGKTAAQTAIAWTLAQPGVVSALTGPARPEHLEENVGGAGWRPTVEDIARYDAMLHRESAWVESERRRELAAILATERLTTDRQAAYQDLLYVCEGAADLGLATEADIMPIALDLMASQKDGLPLEAVRERLRQLLTGRI